MSDFPIPPVDKDEANYAHCQVSEVFPIPAEEFFAWYMAEKPENFMKGTLLVSPVTGVEPLSEEPFGPTGTTRLFHFKDGTIAREVVLSNKFPKEYSYQPYGYDNPICHLSDYAKATMSVEPHAEGCRVVWDYAFHAKNKYALQVVKIFVSLDWKRNLENALGIIKNHFEIHGTSKHMDETKHLKKAA